MIMGVINVDGGDWQPKLHQPREDEYAMLYEVPAVADTSRLSCL